MSSTSYPQSPQDWRGRFIANMSGAVARQPEVALSLWAPPGTRANNVGTATTAADALWLQALAEQGGMAHLLRTRKLAAMRVACTLLWRLGLMYRRHAAEVVHANWLQTALPLWGTRTPALIAVLGTDFALLRLPGMRAALRAMLRQRRAILAPNAEWMRPVLEQAFGDLAEVRPIAFGVDDAWLNLARTPTPDGVQRWLAITRLTNNKLGDLFRWGAGLFNAQRQLHLFGPMQEAIDIPAWVHYHGPTHPAQLLQDWFPHASGLITLSRHDEGRPQVMLEAMASGLPVLASHLPAHCDLLQHQQTGWIARTRAELVDGLQWLEVPQNSQQIGQAARYWVKDHIGSWDDCAARYAQAYRDLLEPHA